MELNEKLQELRKQKGLTQEELAQALFVSRTAISKWESGRGYPSIDSLKAIAAFFSLSLDALLSGNELVAVAEKDALNKMCHMRDLVFGLLDCLVAAFLFLPLFGQKGNGVIDNVSLLALTQVQGYIKATYLAVVFATAVWGIATLTLQNYRGAAWLKYKSAVSAFLSVLGASLFMMSLQPYAAFFTFAFVIIKGVLFIKSR